MGDLKRREIDTKVRVSNNVDPRTDMYLNKHWYGEETSCSLLL